MRIPLGQVEDLTLEFKGRDILNQLPKIGRSVVSMLNAQGGIVWIGVAEQQGLAVRVEAVDAVTEQQARVFNHLLDTIEPRLESEVQIEIVRHDAGALLAIRVNPADIERPYAQIKQGGRHFHRRVGARTRDMTRDELRRAFCEQGGVADERGERVRGLIESLLETSSPAVDVPSFTCRLRHAPELRLDFMRTETRAGIERLIREPAASGNRPMGWNINSPYYDLSWTRDALRGSTPNAWLSISAAGDVDFSLALDALRWREAGTVIYPYALLEFPTSLFRLMAELLRADPSEVARDGSVVAQVVLDRVHGWGLRSGSPRSPYYRMRDPIHFDVARVEPTPSVFLRRDFLEFPDRCAFHMVRQIYGALGFVDEDLPTEFDPVSRRLVIPD